MLAENTTTEVPQALNFRSGATRKLLARKASEQAPLASKSPIEDSFPANAECPVGAVPELASAALASSSSAAAAALAQPPAAPTLWSPEDETGFQALLARRKAAGYQRRGKDVSAQILRPGTIKPNADTVVATIVDIVAERGQLARAELVGLMGTAKFPHPKAQPSDKGWCQGYVAGAIRNGFLAVEPSPAPAGEA